jgi:hypothetical protein
MANHRLRKGEFGLAIYNYVEQYVAGLKSHAQLASWKIDVGGLCAMAVDNSWDQSIAAGTTGCAFAKFGAANAIDADLGHFRFSLLRTFGQITLVSLRAHIVDFVKKPSITVFTLAGTSQMLANQEWNRQIVGYFLAIGLRKPVKKASN